MGKVVILVQPIMQDLCISHRITPLAINVLRADTQRPIHAY